MKSLRPPAEQRRFTSSALEDLLLTIQSAISDVELAWLFNNCFPNTLDTTVFTSNRSDGKPDTFVITGDIDAMWLRDSAAQVWPYLSLANEDSKLRQMIAGVIGRQARSVLLDPYANAVYDEPKLGIWRDDRTEMKPGVHERKWEVDSLAYFLRLSHGYWSHTRDTAPFDAEWLAAFDLALATFRREQTSPFQSGGSEYRFQRMCDFGDSLSNEGRGDPFRACGLIRSAFRPSDDQCKLPLLIPSNLMAATTLSDICSLLDALGETVRSAAASQMARTITEAARRHGIAQHPDHGAIWAFEVDGYGGTILMDDANAPSLLSLPYFGLCATDEPLYRATREFCLSESNPYFVRGARAAGIGSPHTGLGTIWPMSIVMRALTSTDDEEIVHCLSMLRATHGGTGLMHESFPPNDPTRFTRSWFAWANTLFGELIVQLWRHRPHLLRHRF